MPRLVPLTLLALAACPAPTEEPPPDLPTQATDAPPVTPPVEVCDLEPSTLPFSVDWSPIQFAPQSEQAPTVSFTGTFRIPNDLASTTDPVTVYGQPATVTDVVDDGTDITGSYTATVTACPADCTWIELSVGDLLLQSAEPEQVSLASTARMALDLSRGNAAARNGVSGPLAGDTATIEAALPGVVSALHASALDGAGTGVLPGGAPLPGSTVFSAVDAALADDNELAPALPDTSAVWSLHTLDLPPDARLVVWSDSRVSVPLEADADGQVSFLPPSHAATEQALVFRFAWEDGRQSPAAVLTRSAEPAPGTALGVDATDGDAVAVSGAAAGDWVLQRPHGTGTGAACTADETGGAVIGIDPTTAFSVLSLTPDLEVVQLLPCRWEQGEPVCD